MTSTAGLRRVPKQERARRRVGRVLDAVESGVRRGRLRGSHHQRHRGAGRRGALGAPELVAAGEALRLAFVDHIEEIISARRPGVSGERTRFVAEISFDITRALLERAQAEQLHRRDAVQAELKLALLVYLRASLGPSAAA